MRRVMRSNLLTNIQGEQPVATIYRADAPRLRDIRRKREPIANGSRESRASSPL